VSGGVGAAVPSARGRRSVDGVLQRQVGRMSEEGGGERESRGAEEGKTPDESRRMGGLARLADVDS